MNTVGYEIPDPLAWPTDTYEGWVYELPVARFIHDNDPPPTVPLMPKEHIQLEKRTLGYPYILWVPDTVHWYREGYGEVEVRYWKFDTEPMRTKIIQMVGAHPKPPASCHPSTSVSIGDYFGTTFYLTLKTTIHWHTITGWVEKSEVAEFDLLHYS